MIKINLLTKKARKPIPLQAILSVGIVILGAAAAIFAFIYAKGYFEHYNDDEKAHLKTLKTEYAGLKRYTDDKRKLESTIRGLENEIRDQDAGADPSGKAWTHVLFGLSQKVPEKTVWLQTLRVDADKRIQMSAIACSEAESSGSSNRNASTKMTSGIQEFLFALNGVPGDKSETGKSSPRQFSAINLQSASQIEFKNKKAWRFDLNCKMNEQ
ncbi:MAG: PilN domain-containing protein [Candidatus Riflebacteria bacterium]|nr:PilN domain-containing protein [Candidatus Riflebacteria bacterium]